MNIVWFKRDLRIHDHLPLTSAAKKGPVLPLYIFEPQLWHQPDLSYRHYAFLIDCLEELNMELSRLGQKLIIRVGDAVDILEALANTYPVETLWSHQETWNAWTYERDKRVEKWSIKRNIRWNQPAQNGVVRCLKDRDGWASLWYNTMKKKTLAPPCNLKTVDCSSFAIPSASVFQLKPDGCSALQKGGRSEALVRLQTFLTQSGEKYTKEMSSPVTAYTSCSRLSPYLAFGTLSIREVFQATQARSAELKNSPISIKGKWPSAIRSFSGRLRWHCHFIQKLEDEPRIEFESLHSAYKNIRKEDANPTYLDRWKKGTTGYPMVDACMRALNATGWLNFRMRAMLMSFASYHLWLDWKKPALHLARLFTDYEPGIHYSQVQMQSGTTGINSIRIYNPIKQGFDHDQYGTFIRKWVPELTDMPLNHIHTPWECPLFMNGYPMPIVDEKIARKAAADKIYSLKKTILHKQESLAIARKHGSRKPGLPRSRARLNKTDLQTQLKELSL